MRPLLALLGFSLLLGACGGSAKSVRAPDREIGIELRDFRIAPQVVETRRGELTFTVINRGRLPHNFHVEGDGGARVELSTMLPGRGSTGIKKFRRGTYRMLCTIANHEELGMYGSLVVR